MPASFQPPWFFYYLPCLSFCHLFDNCRSTQRPRGDVRRNKKGPGIVLTRKKLLAAGLPLKEGWVFNRWRKRCTRAGVVCTLGHSELSSSVFYRPLKAHGLQCALPETRRREQRLSRYRGKILEVSTLRWEEDITLGVATPRKQGRPDKLSGKHSIGRFSIQSAS